MKRRVLITIAPDKCVTKAQSVAITNYIKNNLKLDDELHLIWDSAFNDPDRMRKEITGDPECLLAIVTDAGSYVLNQVNTQGFIKYLDYYRNQYENTWEIAVSVIDKAKDKITGKDTSPQPRHKDARNPFAKKIDSAFNGIEHLKSFARQTSPAAIYNAMKQTVLGQDDELKRAAVMTYSWMANVVNDPNTTNACNFFVAGPSGSGKTTLYHAMKEALAPIPVVLKNANAITPPGYRGQNFEYLVDDPELMKWDCGVVFLDECDKIFAADVRATDSVWQFQKQYSLLQLLEGETITPKDGTPVHTNKILFIGLGAFDFVETKIIETEKHAIGFAPNANAGSAPAVSRAGASANAALANAASANAASANADSAAPADRPPITKKLLSEYASKQFLGRFLTILNFHSPSREVMRAITVNAVHELAASFGADNVCEDDAMIEELTDFAMKDVVSGCRDVRAAVYEYFMNTQMEKLFAASPDDDDEYLEEDFEYAEIEDCDWDDDCA